jgi:hypothetical protein
MVNTLLNCLETENWRINLLNGKWLSMNRNVAYRKVLGCTDKDQIRNLGKYLDKIEYEGFNRTKVMSIMISQLSNVDGLKLLPSQPSVNWIVDPSIVCTEII